MGRPLRMAPMGPTLLDEVPLLPRLLLCELDLLEQSVQVHSWPLLEPVGSGAVRFVRAPGGSHSPALRPRPPWAWDRGLGTRLRGHS